ncbi:MAG: flagellar export protein FliJ [Thermoguttaceae bacterium]
MPNLNYQIATIRCFRTGTPSKCIPNRVLGKVAAVFSLDSGGDFSDTRLMFKFRLETLLSIRDNVRKERQAELAKAYDAERIVLDKIGELDSGIVSLIGEGRAAMQSDNIDVEFLVGLRRREAFLRAQHTEATRQLGMIREEIEVRRRAVIEADKEVKVMEKLKERQYQRYTEEESRRDQKTMDEIASRTVSKM